MYKYFTFANTLKLLLLGRTEKNTHISIISNSVTVTHLWIYTNIAIAGNSVLGTDIAAPGVGIAVLGANVAVFPSGICLLQSPFRTEFSMGSLSR